MIEPVTLGMIKDLSFDMGNSFFSECNLPGNFKLEVFKHNWLLLIGGNVGAMWRINLKGVSAGFLGAILMPDVNDGELVASEMFWYVHPAHRSSIWGFKLLVAYEKWAKEMGAKRMSMVHLETTAGESLAKLYERRGYKLREKVYIKDV